MPRIPVQNRSKEKKRKLIVAGMKLFSEKGFHDTGITELAKQAGVSVGLFYSYFEDKKDLLIQVTEAYADSIMRGVYDGLAQKAPYVEDGRTVVTHMVNASRQAHALSTELHREMLALKNREQDLANLDRKIMNTFEQEVSEILNQCSAQIRVKDIPSAARLVTGTIEETMHRCLIEKTEQEQEKAFEELIDMCTIYLFKQNQS